MMHLAERVRLFLWCFSSVRAGFRRDPVLSVADGTPADLRRASASRDARQTPGWGVAGICSCFGLLSVERFVVFFRSTTPRLLFLGVFYDYSLLKRTGRVFRRSQVSSVALGRRGRERRRVPVYTAEMQLANQSRLGQGILGRRLGLRGRTGSGLQRILGRSRVLICIRLKRHLSKEIRHGIMGTHRLLFPRSRLPLCNDSDTNTIIYIITNIIYIYIYIYIL